MSSSTGTARKAAEIRRAYATGAYTYADLREIHDLSLSHIGRIVRGEAYPDASGPIAGRDYAAPRRMFTDAQARRVRERYAAGDVTQAELATELEVSPTTIRSLLRGDTYADVGGPLSTTDARQAPRTRQLTSSQVRRIRQLYADGTSQAALGREFGVGQTMISQIVRGLQYPDAGGPTRSGRDQRRFTPDQIRTLRASASDPSTSLTEIAQDRDVSLALISRIVSGQAYGDVESLDD